MRKNYLPSIKNTVDVVGGGDQEFSDEDLLFLLIRDSTHQKRRSMVRHLMLDQAAQAKANDMARLNFFAHTSPEGVTANENVRATGFILPDLYPIKGNNVESLSIGGNEPEDIANSWLKSPFHRSHVYGEDNFFAVQECIGIGKAIAQDGRFIYVFISAPCP